LILSHKQVPIYHIARGNACKSAKLRCAELFGFMPPLQASLRTSALVMAMAFPHHAVQEATASDARALPGEMCEFKNGERCGGE
jgi:hypothetical protein